MLSALIANIQVVAQEGAGTAAEQAGSASHTPAPPAEVLFSIAGIPVANTVFTAWFVILVMVLVCWLGTRKMQTVPTGLQNFLELAVETWISVVEGSMGRKGRRFVPLLATLFLFIVCSNWMGILPGFGELTVGGHNAAGEAEAVPVFRSANSDLNLTAAMAVLVIVLAEFYEFRSLGPGGYVTGMVWPNILRWMEIFTRPLSLAFRLFGNIFAGEVLVVTILALAPYAIFVFLGLELFVGFIQALVFAMLAMVYLTMATLHEHVHDEEHDLAAGAERALEHMPGNAESVL